MNLNKKLCGYWALLLMASFILLNGCNSIEVGSNWRDKDIVIDAKNTEWQDYNVYSDEKTQTSIGICNDDSYVYMCLSTSNAEIWNEIIQKGFIVWFNSKGSTNKQLGVRFPVIEQMGEGGPGGQGGQGGQPGGMSGPGGSSNSVSLTELKILTSEKDKGTAYSLQDAAKMGISAKISAQNDKLVYELKMPLKKTDKTTYVVTPSAKNHIGIGLMIYGATSRSASGISGFGGGTSDMGSGGGGMGGGGGGMDSRDGGFNMRDISSMSNVFSLFSTSDDNVSSMSNDDVSIINAQGGGGGMGGGGMGGGMGGGGMGGGGDDMGGGSASGVSTTTTKLAVWFDVTLATK